MGDGSSACVWVYSCVSVVGLDFISWPGFTFSPTLVWGSGDVCTQFKETLLFLLKCLEFGSVPESRHVHII